MQSLLDGARTKLRNSANIWASLLKVNSNQIKVDKSSVGLKDWLSYNIWNNYIFNKWRDIIS